MTQLGDASCALCGAGIDEGIRARNAHLRAIHPATHRAFAARLVTPWIYLATVVGALVLRWPVWIPLAVLVVALGVSFVLRRDAAFERSAQGSRIRPTARELLEGGGLGALALLALVALIRAIG